VADGSWIGAQHLAAQVIPPMISNQCGDVVLISPELVGASLPALPKAHRMLDAWVAGLDAEFVGTGVRAAIVHSTGSCQLAAVDVGCLIATVLNSARMHLSVLDVIPPVPARILAKERKSRWPS
jgi:hypothetical protein